MTLNFLFYQVYRNHPGFARCFIPKFDKKAHGISVLAPKSMTLIALLRPGAIFPACGLVFWKNSSILEAISRGIQSGTLQQYHQLCRTAGLGIHGSGSHCTTSYKWVLRRFAVYVRTGGHSGGMAAGRVNPIGWYVCTQQKSVKRL